VGALCQGECLPLLYKLLNCTKFGQLILRKIIKIIPTRCQILRLKCTKFDFGWGSLGELRALPQGPDPLAGFKGAASRQGRGRGGKREGEGWGGTGRGGEEGRESKGRDGGKGKCERGNGRDGTGHGEGKRKAKGGRGKGRRGATAPNFNSWCRHCT